MDTGVCSGFMIFRAVLKIYHRYFPSGYVLAGDASIPYWAITDPKSWTYATFNIQDANATYQKNPSYVTPSVSSSSSGSSSGSSSSSSSSKSSPSSDSIDVGGIVGITVGTLAALSFFAIGAYLVYRRHVYKKGVYASVINQQPFIDRGDGAATRMTHHFPSDSSNFSQRFGSPALYGQSLSPSQYGTVYSPQPQMAYPSLQGSFSPPPRTGTHNSIFPPTPPYSAIFSFQFPGRESANLKIRRILLEKQQKPRSSGARITMNSRIGPLASPAITRLGSRTWGRAIGEAGSRSGNYLLRMPIARGNEFFLQGKLDHYILWRQRKLRGGKNLVSQTEQAAVIS
ncbi:hypothetical protein BDR05DRAFT_948741 [Suillus weaverae]|nr:hypothetical protein BDR05DRAFT_948741 [Suillus weaverae]